MACRGIHEDYAVLDCSYCNGKGNLWILKDNFPPRKEACKICKGTCLIKIHLKNVPVLDYTLEIK